MARMIVPQFWAEAQDQCQRRGRKITVRRFGWSETSTDEAEAMARIRVAEAIEALKEGNKINRREPKVAYNGAQGVPIREEVVARFGASVITRNSYGALCLNSPDVLFADIDFDEPVAMPLAVATAIFFWILAVLGAINKNSPLAWVLTAIPTIIVVIAINYFVKSIRKKIRIACAGGIESFYRQKISKFLASHEDWSVRLYRTPAGFRLLATNRPFSPNDADVTAFFEAIGADPLYRRMCLNQSCFRARLTAKPWRIGISQHMRPRPGVWPVNPEKLPLRTAWISEYDQKAAAYAACRFVQNLGSSRIDPAVAEVVTLHDRLSRALENGLPIG